MAGLLDEDGLHPIELPDELQPMEISIDGRGRVWMVASGPSSRTVEYPQPDGEGVMMATTSGELYVADPVALAAASVRGAATDGPRGRAGG